MSQGTNGCEKHAYLFFIAMGSTGSFYWKKENLRLVFFPGSGSVRAGILGFPVYEAANQVPYRIHIDRFGEMAA